MNKIKAIFLDRDGTLNEDIGYDFKPEAYKLLPGVLEGLKLLQKEYVFFIVTNQSGIGMGLYSLNNFEEFNSILINDLVLNGIKIQKTFFCPHRADEGCICRKPKTKFIDECLKEFGPIDLKNSWMIGDHPSDILFGKNGGLKTIYLMSGHGKKHLNELKAKQIHPDYITESFKDAALFILGNSVK